MRVWIGKLLNNINSKKDAKFWDNDNPTDKDYRRYNRHLPEGIHSELESKCSTYAVEKVGKDDDLYFWYKWTLYYKYYIIALFRSLV